MGYAYTLCKPKKLLSTIPFKLTQNNPTNRVFVANQLTIHEYMNTENTLYSKGLRLYTFPDVIIKLVDLLSHCKSSVI